MNPLSCLAERQNIGFSSCKKIPQKLKGFFLVPQDFEATPAEAVNVTFWQAKLLAPKSQRIYFFPAAFNSEVLSEEAIRDESDLGSLLVRDGNYRFKFHFAVNLELHKAIYSFKGYDGRIVFLDTENKAVGTELTSGNFTGLSIDLFDPEKLMLNTGSEGTKSPVYVSLEDNRELDANGAQFDASFARSLTRLTSVVLEEVGTSTATEITVDIKSNLDNTPLLGLVVGDFTYSGGTINTATDNEDGTYTLAGVGLTTGSLTLVSAATLSVPGFEALAPITITIA